MLESRDAHHGSENRTVNDDSSNSFHLNALDEVFSRAISKAGDKTSQAVNKQLGSEDFSDAANKIFGKIDINSNGELSREELGKAMEDPQFKGQDAQALAALYQNFDRLKNTSSNGSWLDWSISKADLEVFDSIQEKENKLVKEGKSDRNSDQAKVTRGVDGILRDVFLDQDRHAPKSLYGDKDPLKSINPDAIDQGYLGDCYFLAPLASVAATSPELIRDAIKDNGDGTYTVTFPGAKDEPITVKAPTEAEQGLFNHSTQNGTWASVMEKAYGEYCKRYPWRKSGENQLPGPTPAEGSDGGGLMEGPLSLLTGKNTDWELVNPLTSEKNMAKKLEAALAGSDKRAVSAAIFGDVNLFQPHPRTEDGFTKGHVYSILDFKPDGNGSGSVTIRNPWGDGQGTDGTITIPLKKFLKNFNHVAIEK